MQGNSVVSPGAGLHGSDDYLGASTSTASKARTIAQTQHESSLRQGFSQLNKVETIWDLLILDLDAKLDRKQIDGFVDLLKSKRLSDSPTYLPGSVISRTRYFCDLCEKPQKGPYEFKVRSRAACWPKRDNQLWFVNYCIASFVSWVFPQTCVNYIIPAANSHLAIVLAAFECTSCLQCFTTPSNLTRHHRKACQRRWFGMQHDVLEGCGDSYGVLLGGSSCLMVLVPYVQIQHIHKLVVWSAFLFH